VLSARLNVDIVPSCELSLKDRKRMKGAKGSRTNIQVGNKSKGNVTLMSHSPTWGANLNAEGSFVLLL
jgi:hypothetical protein